MGSTAEQGSERDRRVDEAVAAYYEALEAGRPLSPDEFLARYPDLTEELASFLVVITSAHSSAGSPGSRLRNGSPALLSLETMA